MKKLIATILVCLCLIGCAAENYFEAEGVNAYAVVQVSAKKEELKNDCKCNGTGKIKADGKIEITCPCGKDCKCGKAKTQGIQLLYFTGPGCPHCKRMEKEFENMKKNGWSIGPDGKHIKTYNVVNDPQLAEQYKIDNMIPTLVKLVNGKEVARHVGFMDSWAIGAFWSQK